MGKKRPFSRPRSSSAAKSKDGDAASAKQTVDGEEAKRRARQKELREIALAERAKGKKYNKYIGKRLIAAKVNRSKAREWREKSFGPRKGKELSSDGPPPEVVIVPIAWQERRGEYEHILNTCSELHRGIEASGLTCVLDDSNEFMPGTKFKYWEQRGVKLRIEMGPRDVRQKLLTIAITTIPGQVANKQTIKHISEEQVSDHLKRLLKEFAGSSSHVKFNDENENENENEQERREVKFNYEEEPAAGSAPADPVEERGGAGENEEKESEKKKKEKKKKKKEKEKEKKKVFASGDDLGDDFVPIAEDEA